jgi:hypothetical protein
MAKVGVKSLGQRRLRHFALLTTSPLTAPIDWNVLQRGLFFAGRDLGLFTASPPPKAPHGQQRRQGNR